MGRRSVIGWILLAGVMLTATALLWGMMRKRFSTGTTYPPLSTLRADPLGARAIYEALDRLPAIRTERNFRQLKHLSGAAGKTLFLLNTSEQALNNEDLIDGAAVAAFAVDGGRVVITIEPHKTSALMKSFERAIDKIEEENKQKRAKDETTDDDTEFGDEDSKDSKASPPAKAKEGKKKGSKKKNPKSEVPKPTEPDPAEIQDEDDDVDDAPPRHRPSLGEALKFNVGYQEFVQSAKGGAELKVPPLSPLSAIPMPQWFSNTEIIPTDLTESDDGSETMVSPKADWEPLAFRSDRAMIAQRRVGTGSVVVCSDSFFMSNEALWREPSPEFLLWLTGGAETLIFDERHHGLGLGDDPGIMNLARRYRMHGLFMGGIVLFLLFVWRNTSTLIPHDESADLGLGRTGLVSGEGASAGLVSLLRRGTPRGSLLARCLDLWCSTPAATGRIPAARIARARQELDAALNDPVQRKNVTTTYQRIAQTLHSKPPAS